MDFDRLWHGTLRRPYRLYIRDHGGDGPVIVLLHGIAASSDHLSELVTVLTPSYRCITIDLLGFGKSPKPQWYDYRMEDHLHQIHAAIKRLRLFEQFVLLGHSLGSLLATRYAREHPKHISKLLLLSPPVYDPLDTITSKLARRRTAMYFRLYRFFRIHPSITPQNFERLKVLLPLPRSVIRNRETWLPFERSLEHCIEQQTIRRDIRELTLPIDVFYGSLDSVIVPFNIRQLTNETNITIHRLPSVNHDISKRYAKAVAGMLKRSQI